MAIIGFNYTKISGERNKAPTGKIELNHNIHFVGVEETAVPFGDKSRGFVKLKFNFDIIYSADVGKITLAGEIIYEDTKEIIKEIIKTYNKEKTVITNLRESLVKFVFDKSILKALELSDELALPRPIPLTSISFDKKGSTDSTKNIK